MTNSDDQKLLTHVCGIQFAEKDMRAKLASRPEIAEHIVPKNFAVGCRRPTPGNGYLEALCEDNVTVVTTGIQCITPKGIKTSDGVEHEVDVIICGTGFDVSWRPRYPTIGRQGISLSDYWRDVPNTYLSMTVANFPNYISTCTILAASWGPTWPPWLLLT